MHSTGLFTQILVRALLWLLTHFDHVTRKQGGGKNLVRFVILSATTAFFCIRTFLHLECRLMPVRKLKNKFRICTMSCKNIITHEILYDQKDSYYAKSIPPRATFSELILLLTTIKVVRAQAATMLT